MQRLMNVRVEGSAIKIGSLLQAKWRAQEWAKENIHECLDDCNEHALLDITEPDGVAVNVQCPILSKECPRGRKYLSAINSLAVESMPHDIPKLWLYVDAFLGNSWSLTIHAMTGAEVATLKTFWENHKGRVIPFKWVNPTDGSTYYVRFSSSSLLFQRVSKTHWSCSFLISEAHPLEIEVSGV